VARCGGLSLCFHSSSERLDKQLRNDRVGLQTTQRRLCLIRLAASSSLEEKSPWMICLMTLFFVPQYSSPIPQSLKMLIHLLFNIYCIKFVALFCRALYVVAFISSFCFKKTRKDVCFPSFFCSMFLESAQLSLVFSW